MNRALRKNSTITGLHDGVTGDLSGVTGDLSGVRGNLSGVRGNLDLCELTDDDRARGIDVSELIAD